MGRFVVLAVLVGGCGSVGGIELHLDRPSALDWTVGTNGVDGYNGVEIQGDITSEWVFIASNDQGDAAPQTFTILVPVGEAHVTLRPWWIGYKDAVSGIACNSWNGTADVSHARGTVVQFDAACTTIDLHISGVVSHP